MFKFSSIAPIVSILLLITQIPVQASPSSDALLVLTQIGYLSGAADGCRVAAKESNILAGGMAVAITKGNYGSVGEAHALFNNARQRGTAAAASGRLNCPKIASDVKATVQALTK